MDDPYDVVIIGGGMVGATLAVALARGGLRVAVVEARAPRPFDPAQDYDLRVSALSPASRHVLEHLDAWPAIEAMRASPYGQMYVWDAAGQGSIHFDAADWGLPCLGHIVENRIIQLALLEQIEQLETVDWLCPARLEGLAMADDRVRLGLESGEMLTAGLVVGADGPRSRVREQAGIALRARGYAQKAIVATVATELDHRETAWQCFLPTGPLAFLPLGDGRSSIVWSTHTWHGDALMALDDEAFGEQLGAAFGERLGQVRVSGPRAAFDLQGGQAEPYVRRRVALIGDAAHTIHPLAGQGANLGFMDAAALAEVLLDSRRDLGAMSVLRRYERARRGDNVVMMRAMEAFKALFASPFAPLRWARGVGLRLTDRSPLKGAFMAQALGLAGERPALARPPVG